MNKFRVNPPCPRHPLPKGQVADPTNIISGEEFPKEWAKRQAKLQKISAEVVRKFNLETTTAAAAATSSGAEACATSTAPNRALVKKSVVKTKSSSSNPSLQIPQPPPIMSSTTSTTTTKSSTLVHLAMCQRTMGFKIPSGTSATGSTLTSSSEKDDYWMRQKIKFSQRGLQCYLRI